MGDQQLSISEIYKQHDIYKRLEISNHGNIRDFKTKRPKYWNVNKQGYRVVQVKVEGKRKTLKVHRLVAEMFLDPPKEELILKCSLEHWNKVLVKHLDNNKTNNHISNLQWCDLKDNTNQAWVDGLIRPRIGSSNGRSKLTESVVHKVCQDFEKGMMPKEAVDKHGISMQQATKIRAGIQWKHVWSQYSITVNRRDKSSTTSRKA